MLFKKSYFIKKEDLDTREFRDIFTKLIINSDKISIAPLSETKATYIIEINTMSKKSFQKLNEICETEKLPKSMYSMLHEAT